MVKGMMILLAFYGLTLCSPFAASNQHEKSAGSGKIVLEWDSGKQYVIFLDRQAQEIKRIDISEQKTSYRLKKSDDLRVNLIEAVSNVVEQEFSQHDRDLIHQKHYSSKALLSENGEFVAIETLLLEFVELADLSSDAERISENALSDNTSTALYDLKGNELLNLEGSLIGVSPSANYLILGYGNEWSIEELKIVKKTGEVISKVPYVGSPLKYSDGEAFILFTKAALLPSGATDKSARSISVYDLSRKAFAIREKIFPSEPFKSSKKIEISDSERKIYIRNLRLGAGINNGVTEEISF